MTDIVDPATRSRIMSGIRSKNTTPELTVRKGLHALGLRFRIHDRQIPGKPDLIYKRCRAAIFVHGCFWHGHSCSYFRLPGTRREFWSRKISGTQSRDSKVMAALKAAGWRQLTVWECAFRDKDLREQKRVIRRIFRWITSNRNAIEIRGRP